MQFFQIWQMNKLILIADELVRCLPKYAIKILERIHHITENLPNTITIITTDKSKLENTVDKIYVFKEDAVNIYIKKFINPARELSAH